jgi:hypothetical protein
MFYGGEGGAAGLDTAASYFDHHHQQQQQQQQSQQQSFEPPPQQEQHGPATARTLSYEEEDVAAQQGHYQHQHQHQQVGYMPPVYDGFSTDQRCVRMISCA